MVPIRATGHNQKNDGPSMEKSISALQLGIIWQRLTGLMDEVAQTFVRTSFSVVVRENWDLACSLMDANGMLQFSACTMTALSAKSTLVI